MKKERAKEMLPILQAFSEGKVVQFYKFDAWCDVSTEADCYFDSPAIKWRIKPEPKLRPWKPEEVPVGAQVRYKTWPVGNRVLLTEVINNNVYMPSLSNDRCPFTIHSLFTDSHWEHSLDQGKTWHPCGVPVEE